MITIRELEEALAPVVPGATFDFEVMRSGRLMGEVVWSGFESMDFDDRLNLIRSTVDDHFKERANQVGLVFVLTPKESQELAAS